MRPILSAALALASAGCLDPLVSDAPTQSLHVLPPGSAVEPIAANPDLARQIRVNDGLNDTQLANSGGIVPLRSGWARGAPLKYWDLGDTPATQALLYVLVRRDGEAVVPIEHPYVAEAIPGDTGYSPMLLVQHVVVTDRYRGEVLASLEAISDAVDLGLVEEPVPVPQFVDGPIVPEGTKLDTGPGGAPTTTVPVYVHGYRADLLPVGGASAFRTLARVGRLPRGDVHKIRVGNAVAMVAEPTFQNGAAPWSPAVRLIECHVTAPAEAGAPVASEDLLFTRDMTGNLAASTDRVIDWEITTTTKNWPVFVPEGSP